MTEFNNKAVEILEKKGFKKESISFLDTLSYCDLSKVKPIGLVLETKYDIGFKKAIANRPVKQERKKNIKKSLLNGEQVNPIIVNEKLEIIDGQGRYDAWCEINEYRDSEDLMPLKFIIVPGLTVKDAQICNNVQSKWSFVDYIYSYSEDSHFKEDFARLRNFIENYSVLIPTTTIIAISVGCLDNSGNGHCRKTIKDDCYLRLTEKRAESLIKYFNFLSEICDTVKTKRFKTKIQHYDKLLNVIYRLVSKENYNYKRFIKSFELIGENTDLLKDVTTATGGKFNDLFRSAIDIYNLSPGKKKSCDDVYIASIISRYDNDKKKIVKRDNLYLNKKS